MTFRRQHSRIGFTMLLLGALFTVSCRKTPVATTTPPAPVVQPPPAPLPTITLRAAPLTIDRGGAVTLQWASTNAGSVRIEPGLGEVSTNGNRDVTPASSVTYNATATGPGGNASATARVTVNIPPAPVETDIPARTTPTGRMDEIFGQNVQTILFDYDKAVIRADQVSKLQAGATWLKANPTVRFVIEGHCDERGSQEYNLGLGDERGNAVKEYLASQGIAASRMNVVSYGEERPACREQTEDCLQRNRRAAFTLNP